MQMRGRKNAEGFLTTVILIGKSIVGRIKMNCYYIIEAKKDLVNLEKPSTSRSIVQAVRAQQKVHDSYCHDAILVPFRHDVIFDYDDFFERIIDSC